MAGNVQDGAAAVRGKALARVTLRTYAALWLLRVGVWAFSAGASWDLSAQLPWVVIVTRTVFFMCVANLITVALWNLSGCLRESRDTFDRIVEEELAPGGRRPGGVHIAIGPHLRYIAPAATLSGTGTLSAEPARHFHPVAGYSDLGHYMDFGDEICSDDDCARPRMGPR